MFIAIPLLILALAAGVYLLIKVTKEYLGGLFKVLAWLVIVLSLLSMACVIVRGVHHRGCGMHEGCGMRQSCGMHEGCRMHDGCGMEEGGMMREGGEGHCSKDSAGMMGMMGCKMQGDSMVMDKEACEKAMGKEACDKMCKERGSCIMSKDECMKMCGHGNGCMKGEASSCPMHKEGKACCMDKDKAAGGEKKECCKKK